MIVQERRDRLRRELERSPRCSVSRLQDVLGVSRATIRRDLIELEARGELVRVHGGVMASGLIRGESTFEARRSEHAAAKRAIGEAAAGLVAEGETAFLDAGTTCLEVARRLLLRPDVRLVTHSVPVLAAAEGSETEVIGIGGALRRPSNAMVGDLAADWLDALHVDVAFLGASGLSLEDGASTTEPTEASVKRTVIRRAGRTVLCTDASKLDRPSTVRFAAWDEVDTLVTDDPPPRVRARLSRHTTIRLSGRP